MVLGLNVPKLPPVNTEGPLQVPVAEGPPVNNENKLELAAVLQTANVPPIPAVGAAITLKQVLVV